VWIEIVLGARDCADLVASITPLTLQLGGPDRVLVIQPPEQVEIVPDKGLRLRVAGHVVWTALGVRLPIRARVASLLVTPAIVQVDGHDALGVRLRVEKLDVDALPDFVDETVVHRINDTLARYDDALVWAFARTLDRQLRLPARVASAASVDLHVKWGHLKITEGAMTLAISLGARAVKRADAAE
jgi:hypothetical protein